MESVLDKSVIDCSLLNISLFNCVGFSNVGFSCVGFSNVGLSNVGFSDVGNFIIGGCPPLVAASGFRGCGCSYLPLSAPRKQDCYICGSYKKRTRDCTAHFIRTDLLTAGVLANLRQVTEYAAKHESRFVKLLVQQNEIGGKRKTAAATKQLEQAQERISEVSRIIKRLYEDNVNGKISDERFMELSADYEAEHSGS